MKKHIVILTIKSPGGEDSAELHVHGQRPSIIGRSRVVDLFLNDGAVVARHLAFSHAGDALVMEPGSPDAVTEVNGEVLRERIHITGGEILRIGSLEILLSCQKEEDSPPERFASVRPTRFFDISRPKQAIDADISCELGETSREIGRDSVCDIVLDDVSVSRRHASVEFSKNFYRVSDLGSTNGTFLNGKRITQPGRLIPGDTLGIGHYYFRFDGRRLLAKKSTDGARITVTNLSKVVASTDSAEPLILLRDLSLAIESKEFVGLMGPAGCGKSTFMDAANGRRPPSKGMIKYDGTSLYENFESLKSTIGYVPQFPIFHDALPLGDVLGYACRLRLPVDTTQSEIEKSVSRVLNTVGLEHRRGALVKNLSGGQKKRAAVAMELIQLPRVMFLDEVTSNLDPGSEREMMSLFRTLADGGITILCCSHFVDSFDACDMVLFLTEGRVAYFGPPLQMKEYFGVEKLSDVFLIEKSKKPVQWELEYRRSDAYQNFIVRRLPPEEQELLRKLSKSQSDVSMDDIAQGLRKIGAGIASGEALINFVYHPSDLKRQVVVLTERYAQLLKSDRVNLCIMLGLGPLISLMVCALVDSMDDPLQDAPKQIILCFGAAVTSFFLGFFGAAQEIVKEDHIYRHERYVNLQVVPYLASKLAPLMLIGIFQVLGIQLVLNEIGGLETSSIFYQAIVLNSVAFTGIMLGLFVSAAAKNIEAAILAMIAVVIPQVLFSGALVPQMDGVAEYIAKYTIVSYWAMEAMKGLLPDAMLPGGNSWIRETGLVMAHFSVYLTGTLFVLLRKDGPGVLSRLLKRFGRKS